MFKKSTIIGLIITFLIVVTGLNSMFIVEEGFQAITIRLGKIENTYTRAGINFKFPFLDSVEVYPKKILTWTNKPDDIITNDKEYLRVNVTARWKIADPVLFYERNRTVRESYAKIDNILDPQIKTAIARNNRVEVVRSTNKMVDELDAKADEARKEAEASIDPEDEKDLNESKRVRIETGRDEISNQIKEGVREDLAKQGIEIIDIIFIRVKFSETLTQSVYDRMIKSRNVIAERFRSEGEGEKQKIIGKTDKKVLELRSKAAAYAQQVKGQADADAAKIYAEAYNVDPEFYSFWRALESYKETLPQFNKTFSTDMEYFQYLYSSR